METDSFNINWLKEQTIEKLEKVLPGCGLTKYLDDRDQTGFRLIYINEKNWISFSASFHSIRELTIHVFYPAAVNHISDQSHF